MKELIEITSTDDWFNKGEVLWIEWVNNTWVIMNESKNRLAGTSVKYTKYKKLSIETHPEEYL